MGLLATAARADELSDLKKLQASCQDTLDSCDRSNKAKDNLSNVQKDIIMVQQNQINELSKSKGGIFNNPLLYALLGVLVGVAVVK